MPALKVLTAPNTWAIVGGQGEQGEPGPQAHVGPTPPTDPDLDLWWDTSAAGSSAMTQAMGDARYAYGIVAVGSLPAGNPTLTVNTEIQVTSTINYTMAAGRYYRVQFAIRAVSTPTFNSFVAARLRNGATAIYVGSGPLVLTSPSGYSLINFHWILVGDGVAKAFNVALYAYSAGIAYTDEPGVQAFYIEDIGIL